MEQRQDELRALAAKDVGQDTGKRQESCNVWPSLGRTRSIRRVSHQTAIGDRLRHKWSCAQETRGGVCNCAEKGEAMGNPIREALERSAALDLRRQAQIQEQIEIINRIMAGEDTYDQVLQALTETVARKQVENRDLAIKVRGLEQDLERMKLAAQPPPLEFREFRPLSGGADG